MKRRCRLVVELRNVTVPLRVIVVGVDHDFPRQWLNRHLPVVLERQGDHDDLSGLCGVHGGRRARVRSELDDECGQGLRPA
jgi:hypothetical protein